MVAQKRSPGLGRWARPADHVFRHGGLSEVDAEHAQFAVYARGTPQKVVQFKRRIKRRVSRSMGGRPSRRPCQGHRHLGRRPRRRHRRTVSGSTISSACGQCAQQYDSTTQKIRSAVEKRGRLCERSRTAICWRSARISNTRSRRSRRAAATRSISLWAVRNIL